MNQLREYICHAAEAEWVAMVDDQGYILPGIVGKQGARGAALGRMMGGDLIRMEPGSAFPLHIHEGAHVLYVLAGCGYVHIDGIDHPVEAGDWVYVPADYAHGVKATRAAALTLVSVGYPHHEVDSPQRMTVVNDAG